MTDETYVMNVEWIGHVGRPDLVDEVADQFERPSLTDTVWSEEFRVQRLAVTSRG